MHGQNSGQFRQIHRAAADPDDEIKLSAAGKRHRLFPRFKRRLRHNIRIHMHAAPCLPERRCHLLDETEFFKRWIGDHQHVCTPKPFYFWNQLRKRPPIRHS